MSFNLFGTLAHSYLSILFFYQTSNYSLHWFFFPLIFYFSINLSWVQYFTFSFFSPLLYLHCLVLPEEAGSHRLTAPHTHALLNEPGGAHQSPYQVLVISFFSLSLMCFQTSTALKSPTQHPPLSSSETILCLSRVLENRAFSLAPHSHQLLTCSVRG